MRLPIEWVSGLALMLLSAGIAVGTPPTTVPAAKQSKQPARNRSLGADYARHTLGPQASVKVAAGAAINQATHTPKEWKQSWAGFGQRLASGFGKHVIHKTIQYPVARLLHEEIHYRPSGKTGAGARLRYALLSPFITRKTTNGHSTANVAEISGQIGSGLISRLWQPGSAGTLALGFTSAGIGLGTDAGVNVVREFWPEIRHHHKAQATRPTASSPRNIPDPGVCHLPCSRPRPLVAPHRG